MDWYRGRPPDEMATSTSRNRLATALYWNGRLEEAHLIVEALHDGFPSSVNYWGLLGVGAGQLGQRDEALRISEDLSALDRPYLRGLHALWRARIAGTLGEHTTAVTLHRDALNQGRSFQHDGVWVAADDREFAVRLARYCARTPVALSRLEYLPDNATVTYHSDKPTAPTAGSETLGVLEFLASPGGVG